MLPALEQLRWRPDPQHWSIAECLDHVNITLALYLPKIDDAIGLGWREGWTSDGCLRHRTSESALLKQLEPPVTIWACAPPAVVPAAAVDPDWLVEHFHQTRDRYADAIRRATGLDLPRILIVEPIFPVIRSLAGTFALVGATVFGLFPLAAHGGPLWEPMCYAQIGGLTAATFITLLLVPVFYSICVLDLKIVKWETASTAHAAQNAKKEQPVSDTFIQTA